jgi:hypothetical protein
MQISIEHFDKYKDLYFNNSDVNINIKKVLEQKEFQVAIYVAIKAESPEFMNDIFVFMRQSGIHDFSKYRSLFLEAYQDKYCVMGLGYIGHDYLSVKDKQVFSVFFKNTKFHEDAETYFINDFSREPIRSNQYYGIKNREKAADEIFKIFYPFFSSKYYNIAMEKTKDIILTHEVNSNREKFKKFAEKLLCIHPLVFTIYCFEKKQLNSLLSNLSFMYQMFEKYNLDEKNMSPIKAQYMKRCSSGTYVSEDGITWKSSTINIADY